MRVITFILLLSFVVYAVAIPAYGIDYSRREKRSFTGDDINLIRDGLYVGNQYAAGDIDELKRLYNISAILNVAWDLDIRYPEPEYVGNIADNNEHLVLQYSKVGLVDASGNSLSTLAAAVLSLDQLFTPRALAPKDVNTYVQPVKNVLVHCHSGQSRSVTVATLYLYFKHRAEYPTYQDALKVLLRYVYLSDNAKVPHPDITSLAEQLAKLDLLSLIH